MEIGDGDRRLEMEIEIKDGDWRWRLEIEDWRLETGEMEIGESLPATTFPRSIAV